jgi:hypothetical protein
MLLLEVKHMINSTMNKSNSALCVCILAIMLECPLINGLLMVSRDLFRQHSFLKCCPFKSVVKCVLLLFMFLVFFVTPIKAAYFYEWT